jgi:hypothetical protein
MADRKAGRRGDTFESILKACWTRTEDPGPYDFDPEKSVPWEKVLVCDRFNALIAIRVATYGSEYVFGVACGRGQRGGCGTNFEWELDLATDLPVYQLPDESVEKVRAGDNSFSVEFDGIVYTYRLNTGDDERRAAKLLRDHRGEIVTTSLQSRIVRIEGVEETASAVRKHLDALDLDVQMELLDEFEAVDGGVETRIEVECPECDLVQEVDLPFEGAGFWLPRRRSRRRSARGGKRRLGTLMGPKETEET